MAKNRSNIKRYSYLLIASGVIMVAIFALFIMQYQSNRKTQEKTEAALKANLELHLLEISEEAKRGILDQANHILHSFRQNRIRERNIPVIDKILTTLTNRYPEVEEFYVVFFETDLEDETWKALTFIPPDLSAKNVRKFEGLPVGKMIENLEIEKSLKRSWQSVEKTSQTTLYAAFDPQSPPDSPTQYFFHTVYENSLTKPDSERDRVGLIVFKAKPENFPTANFYKNLVEKHQKRVKSIEGLTEKLNYKISLVSGEIKRDLVSTNDSVPTVLTRRFEDSDKLFPNLYFNISIPETKKTFTDTLLQSNIILGLVATIIALIGLAMTWRSAQIEMKTAQLKSDFLANMSHELKTPLTSIRAFGDLIHSGRSKNIERIREYGGIITAESDRLTQIINDILEMSRLEKGIRLFHLKECNLCETVKETIEVFRHSPKAEGFVITAQIPSSPVRVECDENAIRQAILNLLSNANKYSKDTISSKIDVSLVEEETFATIKVRDFGVGISKSEQKEIFVPFQRSTHNKVQAKRGTGLGLAITNEIIKGHNGKISVDSKLEEGSTFIIRLPILIEKQKDFTEEKLEAKTNGTYLGYRG